jgi:hypothetical protein
MKDAPIVTGLGIQPLSVNNVKVKGKS